jgi:hypothetical protein
MSILADLAERLNAESGFRLACIGALLFAAFFGGGSWITTIPIMVIVAGILWGLPWAWREQTWLVLTVCWGVSVALNWLNADNHKFVFVYTCLGLYLSANRPDRDIAFARVARLLIGAVFLIAVIQKLGNPDFRLGAFMEATLMLDGRVVPLLPRVLGLDEKTDLENQAVVKDLTDQFTPGSVQLKRPETIQVAARILTWWTVVIESLLAVVFLTGLLSKWRDVILQMFIATSYAVIPVAGFGVVLVALGIGQSEVRWRYTRLTYLVLTLALMLTSAW